MNESTLSIYYNRKLLIVSQIHSILISFDSLIYNLTPNFDIIYNSELDLKKKLAEFDKLNNELMNEIEENQASSEHFIKEKNDMEVICKKAQQELKLITQRNALNDIITYGDIKYKFGEILDKVLSQDLIFCSSIESNNDIGLSLICSSYFVS